jgi:hemerythrin-like domain-containing protein
MDDSNTTSRRVFLCRGGMFLGAAAALGPSVFLTRTEGQPGRGAEEEAPEISPAEDLMREHGVLRRVLLVYAEIDRRLQKGRSFPMETLGAAADIIKKFVEEYHEELEEQYVFPQFERAGHMVSLVRVLHRQHHAGRPITRYLQTQAAVGVLLNERNRQELSNYLGSFIRMYQPHAAREDTALFPAFRSLLPAEAYQELGEKFEQLEQEKFGEQGFHKVVAQVAELEKSLGIFELAQFTPHLPG